MTQKNFDRKSVILLAAATILLVASAVGSARAAFTYYSNNYIAEVDVSNIGVSLVENGEVVVATTYGQSDDNDADYSGVLLSNMLDDGEQLALNKEYKETLYVTNSGAIDSYVRVIINKSWVDANGVKDTTLSPELIKINFTGNGWVEDIDAATTERTILYYTDILPPGERTPAFTDSISIDGAIATKVNETVVEENGYKTITYEYIYDGYTFLVDAEVNAVQTHNAQDAIKSAWGIDVHVSANGSFSLR